MADDSVRTTATGLCGQYFIRRGLTQKENEALLDLFSKSLQFSSRAEFIFSAQTVMNGERLPYQLFRVHPWVPKEKWAKSC